MKIENIYRNTYFYSRGGDLGIITIFTYRSQIIEQIFGEMNKRICTRFLNTILKPGEIGLNPECLIMKWEQVLRSRGKHTWHTHLHHMI